MEYSEKIADKLNELLEKNFDTEKNFRSAAEDINNPELKTLFLEMARQRYDFGHELKSEIRNFGHSPEKGSSAGSDLKRAWMDLKAAVSGNNEEAVLKELSKGEESTLEEYNNVISSTDFPPSTENILIKHRNAIRESHQRAESLKQSV